MPFVTASPETSRSIALREQKKLATRSAIVEAALDLFADRGFDETSVADVAARAGVSPATVARYFPAKESLLFSERDERISVLRRAIVGRPDGEAPIDAVRAALRAQPWVAGDTGARLLRSRLAILRSTTLRGQASRLLEGWRTAISGALEARGVPTSEAVVAAVVVAAVLDEATDRWALGGGTAGLIELIDDAFAALDRICAPHR